MIISKFAVAVMGRSWGNVLAARLRYLALACVLPACAFGAASKEFDSTPAPVAKREQIESTAVYPTLEERKLGEPHLDDHGKPLVWSRPLPFLAQRVVDLGFDLPNPFGVAIIPTWIRQDLVLDDLAIAIDGGALKDIDFVDFGTPRAENYGAQLKLDAWVLPFMNVYVTLGGMDGEGKVPLSIKGADLFPNLCAVAPENPRCKQTFSATVKPEYDGKNVSVGTVLAVGWERYFFTLPITYAWTDVDIVDNTVTALNVSPRIGFTYDTSGEGVFAVFVGATYLDADVELEGDVAIPTPGGAGPGSVNVGFKISQRNRDQWNQLVGFNWELDKCWSVGAEVGFGGSRENLIAALTYRF